MGVLDFNNYVVVVASEPGPAPSNAVDTLLGDDAADVVYLDVSDCQITLQGETVGSDMRRATNDGVRHAFIKGMANVTITFPLRAFAGAGLPPYYDPIFQAGNLEPTVDNGDVIYRKRTKQLAAMTVHKYIRDTESDNWRLQVATGVRGGLVFNFEQGTEPTVTFTGTGQYFALSAADEFIDPSTGEIALQSDGVTPVVARTTGDFLYADQDPMTCTNMGVAIGGTNFGVSAFELNTAYEVTDLMTVNGSTQRSRGLVGRPSDGRGNGSLTLVDYDDVSQQQAIDSTASAQEWAFSATIANGDGSIALAAPKLQQGQYEHSANGNFVQYDLPYFLNGDYSDLAGDNEFTLTYST